MKFIKILGSFVTLLALAACGGGGVIEVVSQPSLSLSAKDEVIAGDFTVTATFSAVVTGFDKNDISVDNGFVGGEVSGSGQQYSFSITPAADGSVVVNVPAGAAVDSSNTANTAASSLIVTADLTGPTVKTLSASANPTNGVFMVTAEFSETVTGLSLTQADISLTNATLVSDSLSLDDTTYTFEVLPSSEGDVTVQINAGSVQDLVGNENAASDLMTVVYDETAPRVSDFFTSIDQTNGAFMVTAEFSETVSALSLVETGIQITNGTLISDSLIENDATYTFEVSPTSDGDVTVQIVAGAVQDLAGNSNTASDILTVVYDGTAPTVSSLTASANPTNSVFTVTAEFSESVSGLSLTEDDITFSNSTLVSNSLSLNGNSYSFEVSPISDGSVIVQIKAHAVQDWVGNTSTASGVLAVAYDGTKPTLSDFSASANPTNGVFVVTAEFSESVTGLSLTQTDISLTNASLVSDSLSLNDTTYTFEVLPTNDGDVTVQIEADAVQDLAGNGNTVSSLMTVVYDGTKPTLSDFSASANPTNGVFVVTAEFSETVTGLNLTQTDISLTNASLVSDSLNLNNTTYTFEVLPTNDGDVTVQIEADAVQDLAGNGNTVSSPMTVVYDGTKPTLSDFSASANPTNGVFVVTAEFSETVTGLNLTQTDISLTNASLVSNSLNLSNMTYTFEVLPTNEGDVTVQINPDAVEDLAGNGNTASSLMTVVYDTTKPTLSDFSASANPTNGIFVVTAEFSESVTGLSLTQTDISLTNASLVSDSLSLNDTTYTFEVLPTNDGDVTVQIEADAVQDLAGNGNTASSIITVVYDGTAPTVRFSTDAISPITGTFTVNLEFSEEVVETPLANLIIVGNGSIDEIVDVSASEYNLSVTPNIDGTLSIHLDSGAVKDAAGNENQTSNTFSIDAIVGEPTLTLTTRAYEPVVDTFLVTAKFSEHVSNFGTGGLSLSNGDLTNFNSTSDSVYTFEVTPLVSGDVIIDVDAGAAQDSDGNSNQAGIQLSLRAVISNDLVGITEIYGTSMAASRDALGAVTNATTWDVSQVSCGSLPDDAFESVDCIDENYPDAWGWRGASGDTDVGLDGPRGTGVHAWGSGGDISNFSTA